MTAGPERQPQRQRNTPQASSLFVGLDGGGTRTRVAVIDELGDVVTRIEGGASIVDPAHPEDRLALITNLVERALERAGGHARAAGLCCALAGAGREPERNALAERLVDAGIAQRVVVTGDGDAALRDAFGTAGGVLLIGGTGSIAWGREAGGEPIRVGGWGSLLGDEGSAHALAVAALRAVVHAEDGRGPATELTPAVLHAAQVADVDGLVAWTAAADKATIAGLAPAVLETADAGDEVAAGLVRGAVAALADHVVTVLDRLARARVSPQPGAEAPMPAPESTADPGPFRLALSGGLLEPGGPLREVVIAELRRRGLEPEVLDRPIDAAVGAAELARELFGSGP